MAQEIINKIFSDFLNCKYKFYLKLGGLVGQKSEYEKLQTYLSHEYRTHSREHFLSSNSVGKKLSTDIHLSKLSELRPDVAINIRIDIIGFALFFDAVALNSSSKPEYIPINFIHKEKISKEDRLILAFCGSILGEKTQCMPVFGRIIHGRGYTNTRVKLDTLIPKANDMLNDVIELKNSNTPPDLCLNKHCQVCEFRKDCYAIAVEKDHLSLLGGLNSKDITKLNNKGIFTVTQLSYTFRPRRKRKRHNKYRNPHRSELKALSIRENKIYVYDTPKIPQSNVDIFLDIEGIPDSNFYYLIGLLIIDGEQCIEYSLWANNPKEQNDIFRTFLEIIGKYKDYTIYHYGSYETDCITRISKSFSKEKIVEIKRILENCCNLLSYFYSNVYLPTYSNRLKDIGKYLGFNWKEKYASGIESIIWRLKWEITKNDVLKNKLQQYNQDDCFVLVKIKEFISALILNNCGNSSGNQNSDVVFCNDIKSSSPFKFWTGEYALPEIEAINKHSYFDYQRQKVFVRTDKFIRNAESEKKKKKKSVLRPNKRQKISARVCLKCKSKSVVARQPVSKRIIDLKISASGVKRWIIQFDSNLYFCNHCNNLFLPKKYKYRDYNYIPKRYIKARSKYGHNLISWVIFQHIFNNQSFRQIEYNLYELFNLAINKSTTHEFKLYFDKYYDPTYKLLTKNILNSKVLYVDETPLKMSHEDGYAWVFTNNREVISFYKSTREGGFLKEFLKNFNGILVSDFYTAYDSINCLQQKCLIHLIRDFNDGLLKNPFDEEFKSMAHNFSILLQNIVKTIDKYGLKKRHLNKHKKEVKAFFRMLKANKYSSETAIHYQERFLKNRDKLFEFLNHDNVSWNNNNAEHAIKLLATHTNKNIKLFSSARIGEFLKIMSVYQTCVYNNISFLKFLISQERDLDKYLEKFFKG